MFVAFEVSNVVTSMVVRDLQPLNMLDMFVRLSVLKWDRSRDGSDEQPSNMPDMFETFEVAKPVMSRSTKDEQPLNMFDMFVALEVSRNCKSAEVNEVQPRNILPMFVTLEVTKFGPNVMESNVRLVQSARRLYISLTFSVDRLVKSTLVRLEHPENSVDRAVPAVVPSANETLLMSVR